jgi:hypothetical protein
MEKRSDKSSEISDELARLLAEQADFFKNVSHTTEDISEYKRSRDRVRELFAQLASKKVA